LPGIAPGRLIVIEGDPAGLADPFVPDFLDVDFGLIGVEIAMHDEADISLVVQFAEPEIS
jgi:hypothetical protein